MYTKLLKIFLVFIIIILCTNSFSNDRSKPVKIIPNGDAFRGDTGPIKKYNFIPFDNHIQMNPVFYFSDYINITISEVSVEARTQYDLQSNGITNYLVQNPTNPLNMHACFMVATDPNPWNTRNTRYFYTTDGGSSWTYLGTVSTTRSGFPCITMTADDRAVIMNHSTDGGGILRGQIYVDLAPGAGSWTRLDPGTTGGTIPPIWPDAYYDRVSNKLLFGVSQQTPGDSLFRNVCTNLTAPGTFLGYQHVPGGEITEQYSFAITNDGSRYGLAYCTNTGGAEYITSIDDGVTWDSPTVLWTWSTVDSIGTLRSIDLIYDIEGMPHVVFGLGQVDPIGGTFNPGRPSKLVHWTPGINNGNPATLDSAAGLSGSNPQNDVFFSVARGVIGRSADNDLVYVAYNKARPDTSAEGNNFFDVWFRYSSSGGASWSIKTQLTNNSGPLRDWRYPSISPTNHYISPDQYVNIIAQMDSIPGSSIGGAPPSWARMMYIKLAILPIDGIKQLGSEVPAHYSLSQNYPNPFNPETEIEFALPKESFVRIKIFNSLGQLIAAVVNENLKAGIYETNWNATNFPSGIYFYTLETENYFESKKMIFVK